jgi:hypothetical protein
MYQIACFPALGRGGTPHVSMTHPSLRASTPIACNLRIPCPTQSAPPIGLCAALCGAQQPRLRALFSAKDPLKFGISRWGAATAP